MRSTCLNVDGTGIAVGNDYGGGGIFLTTRDGGANWQDVAISSGLCGGGELTFVSATACVEPSAFWISGTNLGPFPVGYHANLLLSPDAGTTWFDRTPPFQSSDAIRRFAIGFIDASNGWAIPGPPISLPPPDVPAPNILETADGGISWEASTLPGAGDVYYALAFGDRHHGIAVGTAVIVTFDGGTTWSRGALPAGRRYPPRPRDRTVIGRELPHHRPGGMVPRFARRAEESPMKEGIHPNYQPAKIVCACGNVIQTRSTRPEIHVELCSSCHPFYTGKQKLVDTAGRVERFRKKFGNVTKTAQQ